MDKQIFLKKELSFTGYKEGLLAREKLSLNQKDYDEYRYEFVIPEDTSLFDSSFYLGLLFNSIHELGWDKFVQKYRFNLDRLSDSQRMEIRAELDECERQAKNEHAGKGRY